MSATEIGEMLGRTTFRTWPKSLKNPQQPGLMCSRWHKTTAFGHEVIQQHPSIVEDEIFTGTASGKERVNSYANSYSVVPIH